MIIVSTKRENVPNRRKQAFTGIWVLPILLRLFGSLSLSLDTFTDKTRQDHHHRKRLQPMDKRTRAAATDGEPPRAKAVQYIGIFRQHTEIFRRQFLFFSPPKFLLPTEIFIQKCRRIFISPTAIFIFLPIGIFRADRNF